MRCHNFRIPFSDEFLLSLTTLLLSQTLRPFQSAQATGFCFESEDIVLVNCCITLESFDDFLLFLQDKSLESDYTVEIGNKLHHDIIDPHKYFAKIHVGKRSNTEKEVLVFNISEPGKIEEFQYAFQNEHIEYFILFLKATSGVIW